MALTRYDGTVEIWAPVDTTAVRAWITAIPFTDWPQQAPVDGSLRPAMVNDPAWHDFGRVTDPLVAHLLRHFPGCRSQNRMLSVVLPGHSIPVHTDTQAPDWVCRLHVPLTTGPGATILMPDGRHHLHPGWAYRMNTEVPHGITNAGDTPRIHFMVDVHG